MQANLVAPRPLFDKTRLAVISLCVIFLHPAPQAQGEVRTLVQSGVNIPWEDASTWSPAGTPTSLDEVRIGLLPATHNSNVIIEDDREVAAVEILNGSSLYINQPGSLDVTGIMTVDGDGSELLVQTLAGLALSADRIIVTDSAEMRIANGSTVDVGYRLNLLQSTRLVGRGIINLYGNGPSTFVNSGILDTRPGFGGLVLNQLGSALLDLDGTLDTGEIRITEGNSGFGQDQFTANGIELNDDFSGTINMATASLLTMNFSNGWRASPESVINFKSTTNNSNGDARIQGGQFTMAGTMNLLNESTGNNDQVHIESGTTIENTAVFHLDPDNDLLFDAATTIEGGTFNTSSLLSADGAVRFNGDTTWNGNVDINGIALQNGNATVLGITNITAGVFDMDGGGGTVWDVNHFLVVNADSLDSTLSNTFDGVLHLDSPFSNLNVQLTGSFDHWVMNGEMDLVSGLGPLGAERLDGARVRVTGELNSTGRVRVAAPAEFASSAELNFGNVGITLMMEAETYVEAGASFMGAGTLQNQPTGHLTLANGVTMGNIELTNRGLLEIGDSPGTAAVPSFENTSEGTWLVEIGGHVAGSEHDLLVSEAAMLDGQIAVDLIDAGGGLFLPQIGDAFTVLTSVAPLSGTFMNDPVSTANGQLYYWDVIYNPNNVTLELRNIVHQVPEPRTLVLAFSLCTLTLAGRRAKNVF